MIFKKIKEFSEQRKEQKQNTLIEYYENLLKSLKDYKSLVNEKEIFDIPTKKNEEILMLINGATLLEMRKLPGKFLGGSTGVSIRLTKKISVRSSKFEGRFVPGPEIQSVIDTGKLVITSTRIFFIGNKKSKEFNFSKLLGYQIKPLKSISGGYALYLPLSNNEKISAIGLGNISGNHIVPFIEQVEQRIAFAISIYKDGKKEFLIKLENQIKELKYD